jgi:hypothetical protein
MPLVEEPIKRLPDRELRKDRRLNAFHHEPCNLLAHSDKREPVSRLPIEDSASHNRKKDDPR